MDDIYKKHIHVGIGSQNNTRVFCSTIDFFREDEYALIKDNGEQVIITRASLDDTKGHKVTLSKLSWKVGFISDIPTGHYTPSDESDEDTIIINYK